MILVSHLIPYKEECVITPCLGLERRDFKNTRPIGKKKKISQLNEFSRRLERTAQAQQKTANNSRRYCKARRPEAQSDPTVWGREGWRLVLEQVGKKQRWERRGGGRPPRGVADRRPSPWSEDGT